MSYLYWRTEWLKKLDKWTHINNFSKNYHLGPVHTIAERCVFQDNNLQKNKNCGGLSTARNIMICYIETSILEDNVYGDKWWMVDVIKKRYCVLYDKGSNLTKTEKKNFLLKKGFIFVTG